MTPATQRGPNPNLCCRSRRQRRAGAHQEGSWTCRGRLTAARRLHHLAVVGSNVRAQLREQLDLPGSARSDCLLHALFCCCAICQEAREIKVRLRGTPS